MAHDEEGRDIFGVLETGLKRYSAEEDEIRDADDTAHNYASITYAGFKGTNICRSFNKLDEYNVKCINTTKDNVIDKQVVVATTTAPLTSTADYKNSLWKELTAMLRMGDNDMPNAAAYDLDYTE